MTVLNLPSAGDTQDDDSAQQPAGDAPAFADSYAGEEPRPLLPEWAASLAALREALGFHARKYGHDAAWHGIRSGGHLARILWYAARGAGTLTGRLMRWWHWTDGWHLESQAIARGGQQGHVEAMRAHVEGKKTRGQRGKLILLALVAAVVLLLFAAKFMPPWAWVAAAGVAVLVLAWHGKPAGQPLIQPAASPARYAPPTPVVITRALGSLGLKGVNDVLREGRDLTFVTDVHRDGEGWGCDIDLPYGVTAKMILQRREALSSGLQRPLTAVWPEGVPHEHEGRLRLWIGYDDMSKMKPKPYPLLRAGECDVFAPVPFGADPRGRPVTAGLFEMNWLIGAAPGQGKTSTVRVLACAAALDVLCDVWVHELAGKGDLEPLAQVSHRYVSGLDDESVGYAGESLSALRALLQRRSAKLKDLPKEQRPDGKITRELAARGLRPVIAIFDEIQNLFQHPEYGKQAQEDAAYVIRLGRAYGIILVLSTQRPDKESIPTSVTGNIVCRFCLRVPGHQENDMILGTSAHQNGYRATVFRARTDAGLGWLKAEADPQVVRTYYLDLPATARIAARARAMRMRAGALTGYAAGQADEAEARDFLADVLTVFGADEKLWTETIAERLKASIADVYASITQESVASQLRFRGVPVKDVRETGRANRKGCERAAIQAALNAPGASGA